MKWRNWDLKKKLSKNNYSQFVLIRRELEVKMRKVELGWHFDSKTPKSIFLTSMLWYCSLVKDIEILTGASAM